jgi:hypothetical protein
LTIPRSAAGSICASAAWADPISPSPAAIPAEVPTKPRRVI